MSAKPMVDGGDLAVALMPAVQAGMWRSVYLPRTVADFLIKDLGFTPEYVTRRIQTLLLDGKVVDDAWQCSLYHGARLALSAAMPGVVGAALRAGGFYAGMRQGIAYTQADTTTEVKGLGWIQLRLYNLIAAESLKVLLHGGMLFVEDRVPEDLATYGLDFYPYTADFHTAGWPTPPMPLPDARPLVYVRMRA